MSRLVMLTACAGLVAVMAAPAGAQTRERKGIWVGLGGGYGSATISCPECGPDSPREDSGVGYVRGGWSTTPKVRLGGEVVLWKKTFTDTESGVSGTFNLYNVLGTASFYPSAASGFFVRVGAGAGVLDLEFKGAGMTVSLDPAVGFGLIAGVGYDARVSSKVPVTFGADYWFGAPGDLNVPGGGTSLNFKHHVIDVTIGLTFR